ncbi:MAG: ParB N-terminal domain-containing protein [Deltaproteobacteria bacterium]|nr:ParB N-terminal domain-containing protein [Deltaproteobacteria bacterium]
MKHAKIELIATDKLIPYINNPKKHPESQINKIASSIKNFGFLVPVVVDKDNEIIAGHGRFLAAQKLKFPASGPSI